MRLDDLICHHGYQDISYAFIWIITIRILMKEVKLRIFFATLIFSHHGTFTFFFHRIVSSDYANEHAMSYLPGQHCISLPSIQYSDRHCPLIGTVLTLNTCMCVPQDVVQLRMLNYVLPRLSEGLAPECRHLASSGIGGQRREGFHLLFSFQLPFFSATEKEEMTSR